MHSTVMHNKTPGDFGEVEEVRAGIDWLSCSLDIEARDREVWLHECYNCLAELADEGHQVQNFGLMGYRGLKVGGSFVGRRDDSVYCQMAGAAAGRFFERIARPDLHISRLDLAVTVRFVTMPSHLGAASFEAATEADRRRIGTYRRRKIWYMSGNDGGYTLYIGSPTSDERARLYNKEVQNETAEYARCWRYETVYRNDRAMAVYESLLATKELFRPTLCSSVVGTWYQTRGVLCPWVSTPYQHIRPIQKALPTDAEKKIKWLQTQVKPSILWLLEHNYRAEMLSALGLSEDEAIAPKLTLRKEQDDDNP